MKTRSFTFTLMLIILALCANLAYSQAPQGISYQTVIRDGSGQPLANRNIGIKITLENASEVAYYTETHSKTSTGEGVVTLTIGGGTQVGVNTFSSIPWQNGDVYVKLEIDPSGGSTYTSMGTHTKLQSVPYALYAESGQQGPAGTNGISIEWLGSFSSAPVSPTLNQAYYNSTDKKSYIYSSTGWTVLAQDGTEGIQGPEGPLVSGTTGQTLYNNGTTWAATSSLINDGVNVGIGTTPTQNLDVNGNMRLRGTLYDYNNTSGTLNQLLTRGTSGVLWQTPSAISIPNGSGTSGQLALWSGTNSLQGTSNLSWETSLQVSSLTSAGTDDPIFEVRNKDGKVVFGVYQTSILVV